VTDFQSRSHPCELEGPWSAGFALDAYSSFAGDNCARTQTGEFAYRFKYGGERELAENLVNLLTQFVRSHPILGETDIIIPVPPSPANRSYEPVPLLAQSLGQRLDIHTHVGVLAKTRSTRPQKEMRNMAQKRANVAGAFIVRTQEVVRGQRVLVLDDLIDTGVTMQEVTRVLLRSGAANIVVLALTRTIHSTQ